MIFVLTRPKSRNQWGVQMKKALFSLCLSSSLFLCGADRALHAQAATREEEFFRRFSIPTLVEQEIDQRIRMAIFLSFVQQFRSPPPPAALSGKDLTRTLSELDRMAKDAARRVGFSLRGQERRVNELFFRPGAGFAFPDAAPPPPPEQGQADGSGDFVREVTGSARLPAYQDVLRLFTPRQLQQASHDYMKNNPRAAVERVDENFRMQRELLHIFAASPAILGVLPDSPELAALGQLAVRNRDRARAIPGLIPPGIEQAVGLTAQAVINDRSFGFSTEKLDAYREQVVTLKRRVDALMDKAQTPVCRERSLDANTVVASKGNWMSVRTKSGQPILPGSIEHGEMGTIYRLGCGGKRDYALARKVMEDVVAAPGAYEPGFGVRPDARYCTLAHWKRHGVGGPRDEEGARALEARFQAESRQACKTGSMIDPEDPWQDLKP
jgi:hypothetical protein